MSYSAEVLADSPLAWWSLGDASTTMADSSGNGRAGTHTSVSATTGIVAGATSGASAYGGSSSSVVTDAAWMNTTVVTAEAWVTFPSNSGEHFVLARDNNGADLRWRLDTTGNVFRWIVNVGGTLKVCQSGTMSPTTLYHFVGTYDGTTLRLYVNGTELANLAASGAVVATSGREIRLGLQSTGAAPFAGTMDEAAVYGTALSAARVLAHYNAGITASSDQTITGTLATETDSVQAGSTTVSKVLTGTLATETDAAQTGSSVVGAHVTGTTSAETDELLSGSVSLATIITGALAVETDEAVTGAVVAGAVTDGARALELDEARAGGIAGSLVVGDTATEIDEAFAGIVAGLLLSGGLAQESDLAGWGSVHVMPPVVPLPLPAAGHSMVVAQAFGPVTIVGTQPVYSISEARIPRTRQRIVIDGTDWTYLRNTLTPGVTYTLVEPLLYGPADLHLPQVAGCYETLGEGDLAPLRPGADVVVQRVLDDVVVRTSWKGFINAFNHDGADLTSELGGEAHGRAELRNRQPVIFARVNDLGRQIADAIRDLGLPFNPPLGPVTGIEMMTTGGTGHLEHIQALIAKAWTRAGRQWSAMPDPTTGVYELHRKNDTTIHATAFVDDACTVLSVRRDISEEPNRIFVTGVTPQGQRVRFGVYPGLKQGPVPPFPGHMAEGDTGDGVRLLIGRLQATGYLKLVDVAGGYDADVYYAVLALQDDAGLNETGEVNEATWRALYDLDVTTTSLEWAHVEPAAQRRKVRPWNRSGSGTIMGVNPDFDVNEKPSDRNVDMGVGVTRMQMRETARTLLHDSNDPNYSGTITFHTGGLLRGNIAIGATITADDVIEATEVLPGWNLMVPNFNGGTLFHVAAAQVGEGDLVTATIDTRFRDALDVWETEARNKETRADITRRRNREFRSSTIQKDSIGEWDEIGGYLGVDVDLVHGWNKFEVIGAMEGTISQIRIVLDDPAEFACAVYGREPSVEHLNQMVPKPLTNFGTKAWETHADELDDLWLLASFGTKDEPCGYSPGRKHVRVIDEGTDEETTVDVNDPTGKFKDRGGFRYAAEDRSKLYITVWVDEPNRISAGQQVLRPQLEAGA